MLELATWKCGVPFSLTRTHHHPYSPSNSTAGAGIVREYNPSVTNAANRV